MAVLKGSALEILRNQLICEQKGLVSPYINHITDADTGNQVFFRYYPTLILPEQGSNSHFVSLYISTIQEDCQKNYYNYCQLLVDIA